MGMSGTSAENFSLMRRPENVRIDRICQDDNQLVLAWDQLMKPSTTTSFYWEVNTWILLAILRTPLLT